MKKKTNRVSIEKKNGAFTARVSIEQLPPWSIHANLLGCDQDDNHQDSDLCLHFSLKSSSKGGHDPIDSLENIPTSSVPTFENPFILHVFYGFLWRN